MYAMNKKEKENVISIVKLLIQVEAVKRKSKREGYKSNKKRSEGEPPTLKVAYIMQFLNLIF